MTVLDFADAVRLIYRQWHEEAAVHLISLTARQPTGSDFYPLPQLVRTAPSKSFLYFLCVCVVICMHACMSVCVCVCAFRACLVKGQA